MLILLDFLLHAIHFIYVLFVKARLFWKHRSLATSKRLRTPLGPIPKHLAVVLIIDPAICADAAQTALTENALKIVEWCQSIGIPKVTLYEEHDRLSKCVPALQEHLSTHGSEAELSESETEYPLTPPPSDHSDSRPLSPNHRQANITTIYVSQHTPSQEVQNLRKLGKGRSHQKDGHACRNALTLCLVSRHSAKPAIASAAHSLAQLQTHNRKQRKNNHSRTGGTFKLSIDQFDQLLENEDGLSSPDFMIVQSIDLDPSMHSTSAIELHGFPPWHIRLTEIYQSSSLPLDEYSFKKALDEFASAELRFGK